MKHKKKTKQGLHILFLLILMGILFSSMSVVSFAGTTRTVGNLTDLTTALDDDNVDEVIVSARISLPDNTVLDGKGKTVRVETPYAGTDGKVLSSGFSTGGVFLISGNVTIKNMTVMGGYFSSPWSGGAITINSGTTKLENVTITRSCRGLSIDGIDTKAILKDCSVVRNVAEFGGGALCSGGTLIMDGCSLSENRSLRSNGGGGAMEINGSGHFYANNTVIANNSSTEIGGAINSGDASLYLMNCTVTGNVTTGYQSNYGGGIGINSNSKKLYAVNSVFVDNYHINGATGTVLTRSDIGFFRWGADENTYLYNCLYAETQGSKNNPHSTNCKNNVDDFTGMAAAYRNDGILIGKSDNSVEYSHPGLFAKGPGKLYVPIKVSGGAASGGTETYFDYSKSDAIEMGYKDETSSIVNLGDLNAPGADKQVTKYYEGTNREAGVIGASGTSSENYYTVKLDRNIMDGHVEGATVYGDTYVANTSVKVRAIANSGKKFKRWKITGLYDETPNPEYVSANPYTFNVTKDVLLTPEFADSAGTSEVTFYSDMAGTKAISGSLKEVETGTSLSDITPPEDLSRDGFYFAGWSTVKATDTEKGYSYKQAMKNEEECILADFEHGTEETVTGDTNFYPVFIKDRLEVHLDLGAIDTSDGEIAYEYPDGEAAPQWWTTKQREYAGNTKSTKAQMANKQRRQFTVDIDEKIRMLYVDDDGIIDENNGMIKATRPGYDLAGWYTAKGVLWNGAEWKEATSKDKWWAMTPEYADGVRQQHTTRPYYYYTVTLTARWTPKNVTVQYGLGDHAAQGATKPGDDSTALGGTLTLPSAPTPAANYKFTGWKIGNTLHSAGETITFDDWSVVTDGTTPTLNITAQYMEIPEYSVTFDTQGGSAIAPAVVREHTSVGRPSNNPTKEGYDFVNWYDSATGGAVVNFPLVIESDNRTVYAHWKINQYTIKFNMNGATSSEIGDIQQDYNTSVTQNYNKGQSKAPTREHYEFVGWSPAIPEKMPAYDLTVEAIWEPISYEIMFKEDDTDRGILKTGYYGSLVTLPDDPVKENLAFVGWKNLTDTDNTEVQIPLYMPANTEPTIIAAQWKPAPGAVNETHSGKNDGKITGVNDEMVYSDDGGTTWKDVQDSQTEITGLPAGKYLVKYKDSGDYKSDKTTIVTIGVNNATISFNTDGGSAIESITTKVGADVTKPADPTKPGYTFAGWEPEFPEVMPDQDVELKAKWTANPEPGPAPESEDFTIPVSNEDTVEVSAKITEGNAVVDEITQEDLEKITGDGTAQASVDTISIDLSGAKQEVTSVELTKASIENLAEAVRQDNGVESVIIIMTNARVRLDADALKAVNDQAKGNNIRLVVDDFAKNDLKDEQKKAIEQFKSAEPFEAYFESNGQRIHDFKGGKATVGLKFTPAAGADPKHYHLYYLDPTGALERFSTWLKENWIYSDLTHFSEYAIVYDESMTNDTDDPSHVTYDDLTDAEKANADKLAEAYGVDKDTAAKMLQTGQGLGVSIETMLLNTEAIAALPDDNDPAGTDFAKLTAKAVKRGKTKMLLQWKTLPDADGYMIYTNQCGKTKKMKLKKIFTKGTAKKLWMKKLKKQKYYKSMVVAYKLVEGQKLPIAASVTVHCTTKAKKHTIAKGVKVNKKKITIKVGQKAKLKGREIKAEKKKIIRKHRVVLYESLNPEIATVNKKTGRITGVSAGTTKIYVYAQNGVYKKIPVTVK